MLRAFIDRLTELHGIWVTLMFQVRPFAMALAANAFSWKVRVTCKGDNQGRVFYFKRVLN